MASTKLSKVIIAEIQLLPFSIMFVEATNTCCTPLFGPKGMFTARKRVKRQCFARTTDDRKHG